MSNGVDLTRRRILAVLGATGAASLGAGYGTTAFLSDEEVFAGNQLVAGDLDVVAGFTTHYAGRSTVDAYDGVTRERTDSGFPVSFADADVRETFMADTLRTQLPEGGLSSDADPCEALLDGSDLNRVLFDAGDCKPGDFGLVNVDFALCSNPGFAWLVGTLEAARETSQTEAELDSPAEESGVVELLDSIRATVWTGSVDAVLNDGLGPAYYGTLRGALAALGQGVHLDGNDGGGDGETADSACCPAAPAVHSACLAWELPLAAGNEVQTDSVVFDLGLYAEQCRHNSVADPQVAMATTDGIDQLAFGVEESRDVDLSSIDPTVSVSDVTEDGDPAAVTWTTGIPVDAVVAEHDRLLENFSGGSSGSVVVGEGVPGGDDQTPTDPFPSGQEGVTLIDTDDGFEPK